MELTQIKKAGTKEFLLSVLVFGVLAFLVSYFKFLLPAYKSIADVGGIFLFVLYGFFVLTRYAAVYTYRLSPDSIKLTRVIGKRNREVQFSPNEVIAVTRKKPSAKEHYHFCRFIFPNKSMLYFTVDKDRLIRSVAIEADAELEKALKKLKLRGNQID